MTVILIKDPLELSRCYPAFLELRPHLQSKEAFIKQVTQQQKEGYKIYAIQEGEVVVACLGLRILTMLAWGKILYIDDLITRAAVRGKGYGNLLIKHEIKLAQELNCDQVHLDSGYARHAAHRLYINNGFEFNCHHLALKLKHPS